MRPKPAFPARVHTCPQVRDVPLVRLIPSSFPEEPPPPGLCGTSWISSVLHPLSASAGPGLRCVSAWIPVTEGLASPFLRRADPSQWWEGAGKARRQGWKVWALTCLRTPCSSLLDHMSARRSRAASAALGEALHG